MLHSLCWALWNSGFLNQAIDELTNLNSNLKSSQQHRSTRLALTTPLQRNGSEASCCWGCNPGSCESRSLHRLSSNPVCLHSCCDFCLYSIVVTAARLAGSSFCLFGWRLVRRHPTQLPLLTSWSLWLQKYWLDPSCTAIRCSLLSCWRRRCLWTESCGLRTAPALSGGVWIGDWLFLVRV